MIAFVSLCFSGSGRTRTPARLFGRGQVKQFVPWEAKADGDPKTIEGYCRSLRKIVARYRLPRRRASAQSVRASQPANADLISLIKTVRSSGAKPRWSSLRPPLLAEPDGPRLGRRAAVCFWNVS
jgi:hypothetical protein